jgi:hypothetical protein
MGNMKTTVEISDPLLRDIRKLAAREGVTLRTLMERGLHRVLAEMEGGASFKGEGRQAEFRDAPWDRLRDLAYEGRGG